MSNPTDLAARNRGVDFTLWVILVLNVIVAAAKLILGAVTGSTAVFADGIASFADGASNIVALIAMFFAKRPRDESHPYGHQKFETYASALIGAMLLIAAWNVASRAVGTLWAFYKTGALPTVEVNYISFAIMIGTLAINIFVAVWERRQGKKLKSDVLIADSSHTFSDIWVTVGVIGSLVLVKFFGMVLADPIVSLIVAGVIVKVAWDVFATVNETFSDAARLNPRDVHLRVLAYPGVLGAHHIRTRGTEAVFHMDLSIMVDPNLSVEDGHDIAKHLEEFLCEQYPGLADVVVHVEPDDEEQRAKPLLG